MKVTVSTQKPYKRMKTSATHSHRVETKPWCTPGRKQRGQMKLNAFLHRVSNGRLSLIGHCALALLILCSVDFSQSQPGDLRPNMDLAAETVGVDRIVSTLISAFDRVDVVALDDTHQRKVDSDLRIRLILAPAFAQKVQLVIVEFANTADQPILDRYINGEDIPLKQLQQVWRNTCCPAVWDSPVYFEFLAAVRDVNKHLPVTKRIRVIAGDPPADIPPTQRDATAVSVLKAQGLDKGGKALLLFGGGHLSYSGGALTSALQGWRRGRTFVVFIRGGKDPEYAQFDQALKSRARPVLFSVTRPPFSNFSTDFLAAESKVLVNGVWVDVVPRGGSTPGQEADAWVYFGNSPEAGVFVRPIH